MAKSRKRHKISKKNEIPFGHVRKPIPRPGTTMESIKDYKRKKKHKKPLEEMDWNMYVQPFEENIKKISKSIIIDEQESNSLTVKRYAYLRRTLTLAGLKLPKKTITQNLFSFNSYTTSTNHSITDFKSLINTDAADFELYLLAVIDNLIKAARDTGITKIYFQTVEDRVLEGLFARDFNKIRINAFLSNYGNSLLKNYYTAEKML